MRRFGPTLRGALVTIAAWAIMAVPTPAAPTHGISVGAPPKHPAGFSHFPYANPQAPKGGTLVLSAVGSFDKLNPFSLKGREPFLIGALVYESLTDGALDEPISGYGQLAESIDVAADKLSMVFKLRPEARFSDGKPITAEDVVFSLEALRSEGANPFYRYYYNDITKIEAVDKHTVRVRFARVNPELPLITGQFPVLPRHFYGGKDFGTAFNTAALGSGPYVVADFEFGKYIRYRRNPDYWGAKVNVNVGKYNFDEIVVKYYRDDVVRLEGLKAGEFDFMEVNSSKQWAQDVGGKKWDNGWIVKEMLKHSNVAGMQGFAFNLKRPLFADRRVRQALGLAFDFEWSNRTLFYGQYTANDSYFDNSELAAEGLPSPAELALLEPLRGKLPQAVFTQPMGAGVKTERNIRNRLRAAKKMLSEAGWEVQDGVLTETATGTPMKFTVTLASPAWLRIVEPYLSNLKRLGVQGEMKVLDQSIYEKIVRAKDFDMIVTTFGQSQSPGNEQRDFWHSTSAATEGSRNVIGIQNPAVDALVESIIAAPSRSDLVTATRALDRVLWHEHYIVPHWFIGAHRVTYWNKLSYPKTLPPYYQALSHLMFWWVDPAKAGPLAEAVQANRPFKPGR